MQRSITFAIPAGAGAYAPEVLYLNAENDPKAFMDDVEELVVAVEQLLGAGALVMLDLLKPGADPSKAASWLLDQKQIAAAVGLSAPVRCGKWAGARIRGKSGGVAGSTIVHAAWYAGVNH